MPPIYFLRQFLLVADMAQNGPVFRYDPFSSNAVNALITKGAPFSEYPSNIFVPFEMELGPDGWLYVLPLNSNRVWRFNRQTGKYAGTLVHDVDPGAPARQAYGMTFGPDGHLYLGTQYPDPNDTTSDVFRFDGTTGALLGPFVPNRVGGSSGPRSMAFGPDGHFYFCSEDTNSIQRHDGATGAFLGAFVTPGSGGLVAPQRLLFGPDNSLYVIGCSASGWPAADRILRYDGATGAFLGQFIAPSSQLGMPLSMKFGPDGHLYVGSAFPAFAGEFPSNAHQGRIQAFHGLTGAYVRSLDPLNAAGLTFPHAMTFATGPVAIRDLTEQSKIPRWMWAMGLGFVLGWAFGVGRRSQVPGPRL